MSLNETQLFRRSSTTYFISHLFFPAEVRQSVAKLYSFVRLADDFVDNLPADPANFHQLCLAWEHSVAGKPITSQNPDIVTVCRNMAQLHQEYNFNPDWTADFLAAMAADLAHKPYDSLDQSLSYVYGSAEVIGLMMSRIMGLPFDSDHSAKLQGRAMQWINFIRDIKEDNSLQRCYFPLQDFIETGLPDLQPATAQAHPKEFNAFIQLQLNRYNSWQAEAASSYSSIPKRYRMAITTAAELYNWTASQIDQDPFIVFERKVKPSKWRALKTGGSKVFYG